MLFKSFSDKVYTDSIEYGVKNSCASYLSYKFVSLCKRDFREWKCYSEGIIDESGGILKENEMPLFECLVRTLKHIIKEFYGEEVNPHRKLISLYLSNANENVDRSAKLKIVDTLEEKEILLLEEILQELKQDLD